MKIGAYQFSVTGNIKENMESIKRAIKIAFDRKIRLILFPECALTGYPPLTIESSSKINSELLNKYLLELQELSIKNNMFIIIGAITGNKNKYFNSAILFSPNKLKKDIYNKRVLWGWDKENFNEGNGVGVWEIDGVKVGIRICFEIRFPEYFRELYREKTDLNIVTFYDVSDKDDIERYELIKAHLKTRSVENITNIISVNTIKPYQTAPTAVFDSMGRVIEELERNNEGLLIYEFEKLPINFGQEGIKNEVEKLINKP